MRNGQIKTGVITAQNRAAVKGRITKMRMKPISVTTLKSAKKKGEGDDDETPILGDYIYKDANGDIQMAIGNDVPGTKEKVVFTKQFATMLKSGVPMIQSLSLLASQQQSRFFRKSLKKVRADVEKGATLSQAMAEYPSLFDNLFISMVESGEVSGNLEEILEQLVKYMERSAKIKSQIKSAMTYPVLVIVIAIAVIAGLLAFVVPSMASNYEGAGKELPGITLMVMDASNYLVTNWLEIIGGGIAIAGAFVGWVKTDMGKTQFDTYILKAPIIGPVMKKIAVGRFCNTMASMLSSRVNLLDALEICANSSGNKQIEKFVKGIRGSVEKGDRFSAPLSEGGLFPEMVVSMITVGEETGKIDEMLSKVSDFYEEEVDLAVAGMLSMIEPILIVGIGVIVAVILLAMYMPMFDMAGNI